MISVLLNLFILTIVSFIQLTILKGESGADAGIIPFFYDNNAMQYVKKMGMVFGHQS